MTRRLILAALLQALDRNARWREDLQNLFSQLSAKGAAVDLQRGISSRGQKDYEKLYPHFQRDIDALASSVPGLTDGQVVLELMKILASAHVAHNLVRTPQSMGFQERLPVQFAWFADGMAIVGASEAYETAQGTLVKQMGGAPPERLLESLAPFVSHENQAGLRSGAANLLRSRAVLQHLGVANARGDVALILQRPTDKPSPLTLRTSDEPARLVPVVEALRLPAALYRSHPGRYYWHEFLEESRALYVQYNRCADDARLHFGDFAQQVLEAFDRRKPERIVIDLRWNGGGDSRVFRPLLSGLAKRVGHGVRVYELIGPGTFSSAILNALEIRRSLHAKLAGEPAGGAASGYGEIKTVTLPNSQLVVQYTSKFFGAPRGEEGGELIPEILAPRSLDDVLRGRDPALERVLADRA